MKNLFLVFAGIFYLLFIACNDDEKPDVEVEELPYKWVPTHNIEELLSDFGGAEITVDTIAIVATVISSDEQKNIIDELYIRDETGSLVISLEGDDLYQSFPRGEDILVKCVGLKADPDNKRISLADGSSLQLSALEDRILLTDESGFSSSEFVSYSSLDDTEINNYIRVAGFQFTEAAVGQTYVQNNAETTWTLENANGDEIKVKINAQATFGSETIGTKAGLVNGLYVKENGSYFFKIIALEDLEFKADRRAPFDKMTFDFGENTLPYQIMYPRDYDPSGSYPLVVFLHGAGERGNNNTSQMANGPDTFGSYEARTDYPAIVIFPQCPSDVMWSRREKYTNDDGVLIFEFPVEENPNYAMEMVIELVKKLTAEEAVDSDRIYITGLSMGGIGTFEFLYYAPELAAAGISMAGGHDPELLSTYGTGLSFRLYHGADDGVVPARYSQGMYDKMIELGITAQYTEAAGRGHEWNYVLNDPEYLEWMFNQSK